MAKGKSKTKDYRADAVKRVNKALRALKAVSVVGKARYGLSDADKAKIDTALTEALEVAKESLYKGSLPSGDFDL